MDLTAVCITTSCHHRLSKMIQTVGQLDARPEDYFKRKILSVDDVGEGIPIWIRKDLEESGWEIHTERFGNLTANVNRALNLVDTEWIYYTEDDAWYWDDYPDKRFLDELEHWSHDTRKLGIVGFLEGGYNFESPDAIEYLKDRGNYRVVPGSNEACIYLSNPAIHRDEVYPGNNGWIQFPVSIIRTEAFRETFDCAQANFKGVQIESAMTMAWNKLKLNDRFAKVGYIRYPEFTKIKLGIEYARERGERNMMFRNFRQFRLGIPGNFHFA